MDHVKVRNPTSGEVDSAAEVAHKAFNNLALEHCQKVFHKIADTFGERFILVCETDGRIVSSLICTPGPVYINEEEVPHAAVGYVGTLPEYRKQGCAGAMMTECVKMLRDEGIYLSSLWPFSYEYYRKFGWEIASEVRTYSAEGKVFAGLGNTGAVRGFSEADLNEIKGIYAYSASHYNGPTVRDDRWWNGLQDMLNCFRYEVGPGMSTVVHMDEDGEIDGYAVYEVSADSASVGVRELAPLSAEAETETLAFIGNTYPDAQMLVTRSFANRFFQMIPNPRLFRGGVEASFQFRVVDPQNAVLSMVPPEDVKGAFTLSIDDPVFKQGFELGFEVEDGEIEPAKPRSSDRLRMSIQTFAQIYSGYLPIIGAVGLGKLEIADEAVDALLTADHVFSDSTPYRSGLEPG